jgi:Ser/Thr protein kinase RdoA (MazF antagonist)
VLAVGDLHVENYGSWRDTEGRLVWGINDFDEAYPLPYTVDLVRLAASAALAIETGHLSLVPARASAAILEGYSKGLEEGGEPFVLAEKHPLLRKAATSRLRDPTLFWEKFSKLPSAGPVPAKVMTMLKEAMPERGLAFRVAHRRAGMGSLGRERFTAIADWRGGKIARETKPLLPSACVWAGGLSKKEIYYERIVSGAVRAPDPFLGVVNGWVMRRLSPFCSRIELSQLPRGHDEEKLLRAMGRELANVHLGAGRAIGAVRGDLRRRKADWLEQAAGVMAEATRDDWREWRKGTG